MHALHQRVGVRLVGFGVAADAQALVALDAAKPQRRAGVGSLGQRDGLRLRPASGSSARHADLQQHIEGRRIRLLRMPGLDDFKLRRRVEQEDHPKPGMRPFQRGDALQVHRGHHLVGDDAAPRTGCHSDAQLEHGREAQAPGPGVELLLEELWRHRRLAVRRDVNAGVLRVAAHPREVVRHRVSLHHGQRQGQVARQHVPALRPDVRTPQRRAAMRKPFERGIEQRVDQVLQ